MSQDEEVAAGSRRTPRKPAEIRALLLASARRVFASKGYQAATTMEIAKDAGVAHGLLFRHFGTKAELFEQAVFEPFQAGIGEVLAQWSTYGDQPHSPTVSSTDFVELVYAFLRDNAQLVAALASTPHYDDRVNDDGPDPSLSRLLDAITAAAQTEVAVHGWTGIDIPIAVRVAFCAILGITVFDRWVFPQGPRHPDEARVKSELATFLAAGLGGRASAPAE